jgi:FRG domain.
MNFPGDVVYVLSWEDLIKALHSKHLVRPSPNEGDHLRSPYVFRGLDVATWGLETSLQRVPRNSNGRMDVIERSLIRSFRKYAHAGTFDGKSEWYVLAVAQHNGLPTRCLDWTSSPLVAAHFACGDEERKKDDGCIWCLNAGILRDINYGNLKGVSWVYDTRSLETKFADLDAFDRHDSEMMLLWEPPSLDQRIANQAGLLSIMNRENSTQAAFIQKYILMYPELLLRIIIKDSAKSEIRDMLDQNMICERTMYPDLSGLCRWLKRYYGKAW